MSRFFTKYPTDQKDYTFDFRTKGWLKDGENIATHEVTVEDGITLVLTSKNDDAVTAWISGGEAGRTYDVDCKITTDNAPARTTTERIKIRIES